MSYTSSNIARIKKKSISKIQKNLTLKPAYVVNLDYIYTYMLTVFANVGILTFISRINDWLW